MSIRRILAGAFIASLLQLALTGSAAADVPKGPYIGVDGGLAWTANLTYTTYYPSCVPPYYCYSYPYYYNAVTYDLGYSAGAQIGYAFGGARVEFEYNYRNNGASTIATSAGTQSATGSLTSNNFMVNALYDFDTGSKWVPYIGLGLGVSDISANTIKPSSSNGGLSGYLDGSSSKFAVQFIFGAEYLASDKLGVFIDWRGLWASNANFNYGTGCPSGSTTNCLTTGSTNYDYWNGTLNVGLHVRF
ncbi:MAG TPA: outer membrane beta-barrel protein [Burkholderiales bacterium]|nr:outer membrane beta-barrel protein [Burkholderiales bacterium]